MVAADKPGHGVWPGHSGSRWRPDSGWDTVTVNLKIRVNLRFSQDSDDWQLRLERPCCAGRRVATHGGADSLPREGRRERVVAARRRAVPRATPPGQADPGDAPAPLRLPALAGPPGSIWLGRRGRVGFKLVGNTTTVELEIQLYKRVGCVWPPAFARQTPARSCIVWTSHLVTRWPRGLCFQVPSLDSPSSG